MAQAGPVDKQQAQQQAQAFFAKKGKVLKKSATPHKAPRKAAGAADEAYYYVFNSEGNNGFVIVSGDDRTAPVFGYSDTGSFDENNIPENMQAWLAGYVDEIKALDSETPVVSSDAPLTRMRKAESVKCPIAPLITTKWNQNSPYNDNCPTYNGSKCATGCVATAMAQVMYYYRAQSVNATTAEIPAYTISKRGISIPATPANSPIDWANMTDTYSSSSTAAQNAAVAALMAYCGRSVEMEYGPSSGAVSQYVPSALEKYFGYATGGLCISREAYTLQEWEDMVYEELLAKRPLFYGGSSAGGGHAFVVDGYDGEGLFHFNWGWGGMSNGYFLLQVANPGNNSGIGASATSDGYASKQSAIFGVNPSSATDALHAIPYGSFGGVSTNQMVIYYWNLTQKDQPIEFYPGFGYLDDGGNVQFLYGSNNSMSAELNRAPGTRFTLSKSIFSNAGLPTGTYILKPMCKMKGSSEWIEVPPKYANEYIIAVYDGTNVTLTLHKNTQLSVTSFSFPKGTKVGTIPVKTEIQNDGDEYLEYLYLFASTTSDKGSSLAKAYATIETGKSTTAQFNVTFSAEGTYNIWITTDKVGNNVIGQMQMTIAGTLPADNVTGKGFTLKNRNDYTIYGSHIAGTVSLKNEGTIAYDDEIIIRILKNIPGTSSYSGYKSQRVHLSLAVGETKNVAFDFSDVDFDKYIIAVYYPSADNPFYQIKGAYTLTPGVEITTVDGTVSVIAATSSVTVPTDAVAVNLVGVTGTVTSVTPNSNPNTLYYIGAGETAPSGLSNSNLVQGSTANEIVLTDGYDFFVPTTFTANTIKYKTTPTEGTSGTGGWTTIALPFDVSHVTANGTTIDWFHSKDDTGKNFWVRQFTGIDDADAVLFGNVEQMEAYVPYIVAFPTDRWGAQYNLVGKDIVFHGTNARLVADVPMRLVTSKITFEGTTAVSNVTDSYLLNAAGNSFTRGNGAVSPFRAYFKPKDNALSSKLAIKFVDDEPTAITDLTLDEADGTVAVYTLSGMRVGTVRIVNGKPQTDTLPKGVYIINGKKVIR
ncbi:MAG: C10 family peptidase [Prevotella sp.]|nr:C10 family peptidase [Prevotella sp.]